MTVIQHAARAGTAVFALGLWVAGPQANGIAAADDAVSDTSAGNRPSAAAGQSATAEPKSAVRESRGGRSGRDGADHVARAQARVSSARPGPAGVARASAAVSAPVGPAVAAEPPIAGLPPVRSRVPLIALPKVLRSDAPVATAPANPVGSINTAVTGWFDSAQAWLSGLPRTPVSDLINGALLLIRRNLFNQLPTARPEQYLTTLDGDLVGTLGLTDAESDPLTYRLTGAPEYGTVLLGTDGTYTYTPGADYTGTDEFSLSVTSSGFNLLDPLSSRVGEVSVTVAPSVTAAPSSFLIKRYDVINLTPYPVKLSKIDANDVLKVAPPVNSVVFKPGDTMHFEMAGSLSSGSDTRATVTACLNADCSATGSSWELTFHVDPVKVSQWVGFITTGSLRAPTGLTYTIQDDSDAKNLTDVNMLLKYAIVEAAGTTKTLRESDIGATDLLAWFLSNANSKRPPTTISMTNVQYTANPPGDPGYVRQSSADNAGDSTGTINQTISTVFSRTNASKWEVSGKISWSPIEKILDLDVSGKYGRTQSETNSRTVQRAITATTPPFSANEILTAPPKLLVTGDATMTLGTGSNARSYSFEGVSYYFPSQGQDDVPLFIIKTEPLQPKYTAADGVAPELIGTPIPNVGFTIRDKKSEFLSPTYTVGQKAQLTASAYQGIGAFADKTVDPRTVYSTSDPSVAVIDKTGALTAVGPGTATITATYKWSIPYGGGTVRNDYVLATMEVTVLPSPAVVV